MITLTLQSAGYRVETVQGADAEGTAVTMRVLVFVDPHSSIMVHVPLAQSAADEIAAELRGKPHVAIAPAGAVPRVRG